MTNWLIKFVDGSHSIVTADTINDAFNVALEIFGKHPRSASFHSTVMDHQPDVIKVDDSVFGYGWGALAT